MAIETSRRFLIQNDEGEYLTKSDTWGGLDFARLFTLTKAAVGVAKKHGAKIVYCELVLKS